MVRNPSICEARKRAIVIKKRIADDRASRLAPEIRLARASGAIGMREIASWFNDRAIPAPRGGKWRPGSIHQLIRRAIALGRLVTKPRSKQQAAWAANPARLATRAANYHVHEARRLSRKARRQGQANPEA
jgi:hypothetical protein